LSINAEASSVRALAGGSCRFSHAGDAVRAMLAMGSARWPTGIPHDGPLTPEAIADR
jgi:hypothetical protein